MNLRFSRVQMYIVILLSREAVLISPEVVNNFTAENGLGSWIPTCTLPETLHDLQVYFGRDYPEYGPLTLRSPYFYPLVSFGARRRTTWQK
jgi:hypothetical protein